MLKRRNAQNMSIALIIAAVIGLIVLVVVLAIFGNEAGSTVKTLDKCETRGGECEPNGCASTQKELFSANCDGGAKCCIKISSDS